MASEIRVDKINSLSGVGTVTLSPTGVDIAGITTVATINVDDKILHTGDTDTAIRFPEANHISMETGGSERLRIKGNGNIGLGTDDPNNKLHVYGGQIKAQTSTDDTNTNVDLIRAQCGSSGSALFAIRAADAEDDNSRWDIKTNANEALSFTVGAGSEKLRIEANGKVGIATTNPTNYQLLTLSSDSAVARFERTGGAWAKVDIRAGTTAGNSYITFSDSATSELGAINYEHSDETLRFETYDGSSKVERFRIENDGDVRILDGDLIIGTAGHGIDFSAQTASSVSGATPGSEVLDHYEEGTWTPVVTFGGGSTGLTYTARDGEYTRIGRQVTITFMINLSDKGSSTGYATVTGLPFTIPDLIGNTVIEASGSASYWNNFTPHMMWVGYSAETSTSNLSIRFQPETGASDAVGAMTDSNFTDSTTFRGTVTYFTS